MVGNRLQRALLALTLVALVPAGPALGQSRGTALHAGTLEVPLNKSQVVSADRPIAKALVGSADIADVLPITDRSLYVLGKKMGTTSLTLYDSAGRVLSIMDIAVGPDVIALGEQLRLLVPGETIDARISNESVVLTGTVNTAGSADRAMQLAKAYAGDKVINLISMGSSQQVMLEVRFAEVNRSTGKEIGTRFSARSRDGSFNGVAGSGSTFLPGGVSSGTQSSNTFSTGTGTFNELTGSLVGNAPGAALTTNGSNIIGNSRFDPTQLMGVGKVTSSNTSSSTSSAASIASILGLGALTEGFGIFSKTFRLGNVNIEGILNAMESKGLAKTLAQPTLIALSGEKASFLAGGEFPVPVAQTGNNNGAGNGAITVEFKPFGVSLAFTPTVLGDKTISMIVEPEVSAIDPSASLTVAGITIPGLRTRRASTTLELRDGESFAIAGLLQKDFQTTVDQVPLLGSIPILGALFRSSSFKKGETELLIVVTPRLVAPIRPGQVRLPTDRVLDPREADTFLLGQPYRPTKVEPAVPPSPAQPAPEASAPQSAVTPATPGQAPAKEDGYAY
ncbi:MAG TPA: type II and III secretion system protein family protein [Novosphingobium sp.]